ncbi:hypothetical protein [Paenibacillus glacialis]|nr:hypothetical protein [Paenibacillus glacialis]
MSIHIVQHMHMPIHAFLDSKKPLSSTKELSGYHGLDTTALGLLIL